MAAIPPNSGPGITERMRARIEFIRKSKAGQQPDDVIQDAAAKALAKIKSYGERVESVLQAKQTQNVIEVLAGVLKEVSDQVEVLKQKHDDEVQQVKAGQQCLREQAEQRKKLFTQLEKLKRAAKQTFLGPTGTQILTAGSQMCENMARNK